MNFVDEVNAQVSNIQTLLICLLLMILAPFIFYMSAKMARYGYLRGQELFELDKQRRVDDGKK